MIFQYNRTFKIYFSPVYCIGHKKKLSRQMMTRGWHCSPDIYKYTAFPSTPGTMAAVILIVRGTLFYPALHEVILQLVKK